MKPSITLGNTVAADRTHLLLDWTVRYGAESLLFHCRAENITHAVEQCENAYPDEVIVSAVLDSSQSATDFVVVGLPEACQMIVDGVLQTGPWFVIIDKATGELAADLIISDVACYASRENAQEALAYNIAQFERASKGLIEVSGDLTGTPKQPFPRFYTLALTDMGCETQKHESEAARCKFLSKVDNAVDDWYTLDVDAQGDIDFSLATTGDNALER